MLANLLPGLRDLRAPLAAGLVWFAAGYLWLVPKVPSLSEPVMEIFADTQRLYAIGGSVLLASSVTFTAYLIGILSQGSATPILDRLYAILAPTSATLFFTPALILGLLAKRLSRSKRTVKFLEGQEELARLTYSRLTRADFYSTAKRLAVNSAVSAYRADESFRQKFAERLTPERFILTARRLSEPRHLENFGATGALRQYYQQVLRQAEEGPDEYGAVAHRELANFERHALQDKEFIEFWVNELMSIESHARVLEQELAFLPAKLVAASPESYERWDRLAAEAEFRRALMAPVLGLGLALVERGIAPILILPATVVASYCLWISSRNRTRLALDQLSQCIAGGLISSPELDRIRAGGFNWIKVSDRDDL
jgi:hypothetical protein